MSWSERFKTWGLFRLGWKQPVAVGAILRLAATVSGFGYFTADDYSSVMEPAFAWLSDPAAPLWEIRSAFFPRLFSACMWTAQAVGLSDPAHVLQWSYGLLGAWSLLGVVGVYHLAERFYDARAATVAAWLMAAYPLMPRISTRALLEVACIPPLAWGLYWLAHPSQRPRRRFAMAAAGGLAIGIAAMFRFQVGLVYVGALVVVGLEALRRRQAAPTEASPAGAVLGGMLVGGVGAAGLQALVDLGSYGWPFASLYTYITFNLENATEIYGRTGGIYTYVLFFVLLAVPPAVLALARPFWRACKKAPLVSVSLAVFVGIHSLVAHREERFMFSGLPMFFALLAPALVHAWETGGWSRRAVGFFAGVCAFTLPFATLSDSQRSGTVPLLEVARSETPPEQIFWVAVREPPTFYAGGKSAMVWAEQTDASEDPDRLPLRTALTSHPRRRTARFVFALPPTADSRQALADAGYACGPPQRYPGDFLDHLVYRLNPRRNLRRSPTTVLDCTGLIGKT